MGRAGVTVNGRACAGHMRWGHIEFCQQCSFKPIDEHRCEMNGFASQFHRCLQHIGPPVMLRKSPALAGCSHLALDIARKIGRGVP